MTNELIARDHLSQRNKISPGYRISDSWITNLMLSFDLTGQTKLSKKTLLIPPVYLMAIFQKKLPITSCTRFKCFIIDRFYYSNL